MEYIRTTVKAFKATIHLGLEWNYTDEIISTSDVITEISAYQKKKLATEALALSVSVKDSEILFTDQREPHLEISLINYPKFPQPKKIIQKEAENLALMLMEKFNQNRLVIEFPKTTLMLEKSTNINPKVQRFVGE
jgi:hypothetical protein